MVKSSRTRRWTQLDYIAVSTTEPEIVGPAVVRRCWDTSDHWPVVATLRQTTPENGQTAESRLPQVRRVTDEQRKLFTDENRWAPLANLLDSGTSTEEAVNFIVETSHDLIQYNVAPKKTGKPPLVNLSNEVRRAIHQKHQSFLRWQASEGTQQSIEEANYRTAARISKKKVQESTK